MAAVPEVLLLNTIRSSPWADQEAIRDAIESEVPGIDLRVARTPAESTSMIPTADVVVASFLPDDLLDRADDLRWIQAISSGVDFFDLEMLTARDIVLTNAAGVHAEPIAEQVLGYMLAFEREILTGIRHQEQHRWKRYTAGELRGKTIGIVGVGEIGSRVATLATAFGMEVVGTKRDPTTAPDVVDEVYPPEGLFEVLLDSDYVVVACPLTDETSGLIGSRELGTMQSSAVLINIARGEVVDEDALLYELQQDGIRGAALDVFEEEPLPSDSGLWNLPNVIVTPHMAGSTPHKSNRIGTLFAENYDRYRNGEIDRMQNRVI